MVLNRSPYQKVLIANAASLNSRADNLLDMCQFGGFLQGHVRKFRPESLGVLVTCVTFRHIFSRKSRMMENISEIGLKFIQTLGYELNSGKLKLPAFPDVALKVKEALDAPDVSAEQVAKVVSAEPVLSARLLRVANSAAMNRAGIEISDIRTAITRLGFDMVHNTAVSIAMEQLALSNVDKRLRPWMQALWHDSINVAALSFVIAKKQTSLNPDEAMLAGLLHNIGKIYIVTRIEEKFPELFEDAGTLEQIMQQWHTGVGSTILGAWNFSESLTKAIEEHDDTGREHFGPPDLADVIMVANLYSDLDKPGQDWTEISAIKRLDLTPLTAKQVLNESMEEVQSIKQALGCSAGC